MKTAEQPVSIGRRAGNRPALIAGAAVLASAAAAAGVAGLPAVHAHAPDLALLAAAPPQVKVHLAAALVALGIGAALLIGVKGSRLHRTLGWSWVAAMAVTAISSLLIKSAFAPGHFGPIHLLSGWTLIALPMGVYAARRHNVARHRRTMTALFVGGLIVAGAFTFLPGRLMWALFFR